MLLNWSFISTKDSKSKYTRFSFPLYLSMVLVIKEKKDISKLKEALANRQVKKKFDANRFCGALKTSEDALEIQKRLRDEWN